MDVCAQKENHLKTQGEDGHLQAKEGDLQEKKIIIINQCC